MQMIFIKKVVDIMQVYWYTILEGFIITFERRSQMSKELYYQVVATSRNIGFVLVSFLTQREAYQFCKSNNWEWADENCFVWDLDIEEVEG